VLKKPTRKQHIYFFTNAKANPKKNKRAVSYQPSNLIEEIRNQINWE